MVAETRFALAAVAAPAAKDGAVDNRAECFATCRLTDAADVAEVAEVARVAIDAEEALVLAKDPALRAPRDENLAEYLDESLDDDETTEETTEETTDDTHDEALVPPQPLEPLEPVIASSFAALSDRRNRSFPRTLEAIFYEVLLNLSCLIAVSGDSSSLQLGESVASDSKKL